MGRLTIIAAAFLWIVGSSAWAHETRAPRNDSGIPIPFVTHGEMAVLSSYRHDILALGAVAWKSLRSLRADLSRRA